MQSKSTPGTETIIQTVPDVLEEETVESAETGQMASNLNRVGAQKTVLAKGLSRNAKIRAYCLQRSSSKTLAKLKELLGCTMYYRRTIGGKMNEKQNQLRRPLGAP